MTNTINQTNSNNSNSDLILPDGLSIQTSDGKVLTGQDMYLMMAESLTPSGGGGAPLFRLGVTQNKRDPRLPGADEVIFITRKARVEGQEERVTETYALAGSGETVQAWAIGFAMNRSYFASKYDPENPAAPDCRSESFFAPDAQYAGKFSTVCATRDPRTGRLITTCPMAQWGTKDPNTGKSQPPACMEQYIVCLAVSVIKEAGAQPEMELVEGYFKSASASAGKTLVQQLTALRLKGQPFWAYPVDISAKAAGPGVVCIPTLRLDQPTQADPETEAAFAAAALRWEQALKIRAERSLALPEAPQPGASAADLAFGNGNGIEMPAVDAPPATVTKTNGKNGKTSKPLI